MRKIKTRLWLAMLLPVLACLLFAGLFILENWRSAATASAAQRVAMMAPPLSALIHELQKERGTSVGFLNAADGGAFADRLPQQRQETDQAHVHAKTALNAAGAAVTLQDLPTLRAAVLARNIPAADAAQRYTKIIGGLLAEIAKQSRSVTQSSAAVALNAYVNLLQAKEKAGLERATGAGALASGAPELVAQRKLIRLIAEQDSWIAAFQASAPDAYRQALDVALGAPDSQAVIIARAQVLDWFAGNPTSLMSGAAWFDATTRRIELLRRVENTIAADIEKTAAAVASAAQTRAYWALAGSVMLLSLSLLFALRLVRDLLGQLSARSTDVARLARADYADPVQGLSRTDEMGELAQGLEVLRVALQDARQREQMQFETVSQRSDHLETLAAHFTKDIESLLHDACTAMTALQSEAAGLHAQSAANTNDAKAASARTAQALAAAQTAASATVELSASMQEINRRTSDVAQLTDNARQHSDQAVTRFADLSQAVTAITSVVSFIEGIAENTNLLALNATIEAARAGPAGKGFAVVAGEVKALALETARATIEVHAKIRSIQDAIGDGRGAVGAVEAALLALNQAASSIASAVAQQDGASSEIARSATIVADDVSSVNERLGAVAQAASTADASAATIQQVISRMESGLANLSGCVSQFVRAVKAA
jgi:methyl-accepting chemotaxis protein